MKSAVLVVAATLVASAAFAETKIGYVDLRRALQESDSGKKVQAELQGEVDKVKGSLKRKQDELDGMKEQITKKSAVMKDEERLSMEEDFRRKARDLERSAKDAEGDLERKQHELTADMLKDLQEIIRDYGESEGYTVILELSAGGLLYGAKGSDITETVLEQYNAKHPAKKK